ncbi:MAG: D-alanyl-D-alanine carboxypeptidase, partial [Marinobacter sp.]|nr:D-alanyl-D-alanine carboxypeptidase [Marinobacter sp.]
MNTQGLQAGKSLATGRFASGAVALAIALASAPLGQAFAQEQTSAEEAFASSRHWASQIRSYASKSLNSDEALSVAVIPLNGPGIEQYVNADTLMSPGSIMKLVTTYAAL